MIQHPIKHEMKLIRTYTSGAEEWLCPTCGRHLIIQWPPNYHKTVLEHGNTIGVFHSCCKSGISNDQIMSDDLCDALDEFFEEIGGW